MLIRARRGFLKLHDLFYEYASTVLESPAYYAYLSTLAHPFLKIFCWLKRTSTRERNQPRELAVMSALSIFRMDKKYERLSMQARADAADADLGLIENLANSKHAQLMALRDSSYEKLAFFGLGQAKTGYLQDTAFHPWNRSKAAIVPSKVLDKVDKFHVSGVSMLELSKISAVGRPAGSVGNNLESDLCPK